MQFRMFSVKRFQRIIQKTSLADYYILLTTLFKGVAFFSPFKIYARSIVCSHWTCWLFLFNTWTTQYIHISTITKD